MNRWIIRILCLSLAASLSVTVFVSERVEAMPWTIETVDSAKVGARSSITIDSIGNPRISSGDQTIIPGLEIKYALWNGTDWKTENTGLLGYRPSMALDVDDNPHIAYMDNIDEDLEYAYWNGSTWNTETVDSVGWVGFDPSLALDINGYPHICYKDVDNQRIKYANWNGSAWNVEDVDPPGSNHGCSLVLDTDGNPHVSYNTAVVLKYARRQNGSWTIEVVDSAGPYLSSSIALDSDNHPHISYRHETTYALKYAERTGLWWEVHTVDDESMDFRGGTSLVLDSRDYPRIAYRVNLEPNLRFAMWTGDSWIVEVVDGNGMDPSLAVDARNRAHISYQDVADWDLKYARGPSVPLAPQNLTAKAGDGQVVISWSPPESDGGSPITSYVLYRDISQGAEVFLARPGNVNTYVDAGVTNGQTYYYTVSAENILGESPRSDEVSATPRALNLPPVLSGGLLSPDVGDTMTAFSYEVVYSDPEGDAPAQKNVYIDNAPYEMSYVSGSNATGALYRHSLSLPAGNHEYFFGFDDANGHHARLPVFGAFAGPSVTGINEPPQCSILSPTEGREVSGTVAIAGSASDSDGPVQRVEMRIDDGVWFWATGTESWGYQLDTRSIENGQHMIEARSWDGTDYSSSAGITVIVENPETTAASTLENPWFWVAVALMIVLVLAALVMIWKRRSGGSQEESEENLGQG